MSRWNRHDIEYAIEKGDPLYKLQNTDQLIYCTSSLPRVVQIEHLQVLMNFLEEIYGFWKDSHKKNIINLTRQILTVTIAQGFYF